MMVPIWMLGVGSLGGFVIGGIVRQPEINKLKKQVRDLQNKNSKLQKRINEQQENVETLMVEYGKLKFYQILHKRKQKQYIRGGLLIEYQYKEYVDLLLKVVKENGIDNLSEEQKQYFELCTRIIEEKDIAEDDKRAMQGYILKKYKKEIWAMQDPQLVEYIKQVA